MSSILSTISLVSLEVIGTNLLLKLVINKLVLSLVNPSSNNNLCSGSSGSFI